MSLVLNMVAGGGGAGGDVFAFIVCNYPAGSVCTATNGTITLTAPDTSGSVAFKIPTPASTPESWTVTITNGNNTHSKTVSISSEGESVAVRIRYPLYIIQSGYFVNGFSFANNLRSGRSPTVNENYNSQGYVRVYNANTYVMGKVTDSTDLTDYSEIKYDAYATMNATNGYFNIGAFNGINKSTADDTTATQIATVRVGTSRENGSVDISGIDYSAYVGVYIYTNTSTGKSCNIYNLWLE